MKQRKQFRLFGQKIQALRKRRNWTQADLAEAIGRSVHLVSAIERGVTGSNLITLTAIAAALGVPASELFETSDVPKGDRDRRKVVGRVVELLNAQPTDVLLTIAQVVETLCEGPKARRSRR